MRYQPFDIIALKHDLSKEKGAKKLVMQIIQKLFHYDHVAIVYEDQCLRKKILESYYNSKEDNGVKRTEYVQQYINRKIEGGATVHIYRPIKNEFEKTPRLFNTTRLNKLAYELEGLPYDRNGIVINGIWQFVRLGLNSVRNIFTKKDKETEFKSLQNVDNADKSFWCSELSGYVSGLNNWQHLATDFVFKMPYELIYNSDDK